MLSVDKAFGRSQCPAIVYSTLQQQSMLQLQASLVQFSHRDGDKN
jgi:hypothetical protein